MRSLMILVLAVLAALVAAADNNTGQSTVIERRAVADVALLIDQSASIRLYYNDELDFAGKFVDSFPVNENETRFALVQFSYANMTRVRLPWRDGVSKQRLHEVIGQMRKDDLGVGTDFAQALSTTLDDLFQADQGDRTDVPNVVVLVTDGFLNNPWERERVRRIAQSLRDAGALLYAIQVKSDPSLPPGDGPLQDLTLITGDRSRVFSVENFQQLTDELLGKITRQITVEYQNCLFEYLPTGQCYLDDNKECSTDAQLQIRRQPQLPHGKACPAANLTRLPCPNEQACRPASCDQLPWGNWSQCDPATCTRSRTRQSADANCREPTVESCPTVDSCNPNVLPDTPQKLAESSDSQNTSVSKAALPFWAMVVLGIVGGLLLLLVIVAVIISRTPKWRAIFVPSRPGRPQLPGNADDTMSSSTSSSATMSSSTTSSIGSGRSRLSA